MTHSILPLSSAGRWVYCPGSALRESQLPNRDSKESKEGNAVHSMIPVLIERAFKAEDITGREFVGTTDSAGTLITGEMADSANVFVEYAQSIMRSHGVFNDEFVNCEKTLSAKIIHSECFGTPDLTINAVAKDNVFYCLDEKNGHSRVDAFMNWQCLGYTAAKLSQIPETRTTTKIVIGIVQPNAPKPDGPIDTWELTVGDLQQYVEQMKTAAELALKPNSPCRTGGWCKNCKAVLTCDASLVAAVNTIDVMDHFVGVQHVTPASLALELRLLDRGLKAITARRDALREHVDLFLSEGSQVPGYKSGFTRSSKIWTGSDEEVKTTGQLFGVSLVTEKLRTPTQAIGDGVPKEIVEGMSKMVPGNRTIVAVDERIPSTIFGKLKPAQVFKK